MPPCLTAMYIFHSKIVVCIYIILYSYPSVQYPHWYLLPLLFIEKCKLRNILRYINMYRPIRWSYSLRSRLQLLDVWNHRFKFLWGLGYTSVVFVVFCVCSGLFHDLISRPATNSNVVTAAILITAWQPSCLLYIWAIHRAHVVCVRLGNGFLVPGTVTYIHSGFLRSNSSSRLVVGVRGRSLCLLL